MRLCLLPLRGQLDGGRMILCHHPEGHPGPFHEGRAQGGTARGVWRWRVGADHAVLDEGGQTYNLALGSPA